MYIVLQGVCTSKSYFAENMCNIAHDGEIWLIAPMIWGTISDYFGRRPITAACLFNLSLLSIGLAMAPTSAYWLLIVLRCLQAAGSASTTAIGNIYLLKCCSSFLNVCTRRWGDRWYIHSCRTWWLLWTFHAWSFGELKFWNSCLLMQSLRILKR